MPATKKDSKTYTKTAPHQTYNEDTTLSVENSYATLRLRAGNLMSRVAFIGILGWGVNNFSTHWAHKTDIVAAGHLMHNVDMASMRAVRAVEETFTKPLRQTNTKLPAQHHIQAKGLAIQHLKASLGTKGMRTLRKAAGRDLDALLDGAVEAALYDLKYNALLRAATASARTM
ncbi:MAG: hypothetical protein AAF320_06660 [Myxococcota bacterium]